MKIAHECPLSLMIDSRNWADIDYALVHLFETIPEYYQFFKNSVKLDRHVILDNSIFELGEAFDMDKFAYWVLNLLPSEYIIPDSLENCDKTIENLKIWMGKYGSLPGKKIGVVQGKTLEELVRCAVEMQPHIDKLAISFDYSFYNEVTGIQGLEGWWRGRLFFVNYLYQHDLLRKPIHLLGCSLPMEFSFYNHHHRIESVDTSNPIVHAIKKIKYHAHGLDKKESIKLVDLLHTEESDIDFDLLYHNIAIFRSLCRS